MISRRCFLIVALLLLLSSAAAIIGSGRIYRATIGPHQSFGRITGIHRDGWLEEGASLDFPDLLQRGNRLTLTLLGWRPAYVPPLKVEISVCGTPVASTIVKDPKQVITISLHGGCEPRQVSFHLLNPFTPRAESAAGEGEKRLLGPKFGEATVTSALGVPLCGVETLLKVSAVFATISLLFLAVLLQTTSRKLWILLASAVVPLIGFYLYADYDVAAPFRAQYLALFSAALLCGAALPLTRIKAPEPSLRGSRPWLLMALLVMVGGGILRFYGLDFGLPSFFHPDEVPKRNALMRMFASHTLNPHYFLHPTLLLYSAYFVNFLAHSQIAAYLGSTDNFGATIVLAGRIASATAGTVSIFVTYLVARRLFSEKVGVLAAALLAVFPLHVTCSRYLKEDALLLMMMLICILLICQAVLDQKPKRLLLAGLFGGISASSKYTGLLMFAPLLAAPSLEAWYHRRSLIPKREWIKLGACALLLVPVGFLMCSPYTLIDYQTFSHHFAFERNHMLRGHSAKIDPWTQYWMFHYGRSLLPGVTFFDAIFGTVAAGFLLRRRRPQDFLILGFFLLFYLPSEWVKAKPAPQPERYIVPCLPFLAIAIGELVQVLRHSRAAALAPLFAIVAVGAPLMRSLELASELRYDTRQQMRDWIRTHVPAGSKIYMDDQRYSVDFSRKDNYPVTYYAGPNLLEEIKPKSLRQAPYDYLLISSLTYDRYFSQPTTAASRQRLRELFDQVPIVFEARPHYGTYGFHNPRLTLFRLHQEDWDELARQLEQRHRHERETTTNQQISTFTDSYSSQ